MAKFAGNILDDEWDPVDDDKSTLCAAGEADTSTLCLVDIDLEYMIPKSPAEYDADSLLYRQEPPPPIHSKALQGEKDHNPNDKFTNTSKLLAVEDIFGTKLLQAIRAGSEKLAFELLASGANPDSKDSYGFALTQAIRAGYEKLAFELTR
ncbi:hypothetical protein VE03_10711 [Pseudogymnoascus sp. 23342-1-I1]|nr:hypothetical protein VE03_10711 [Pseudogymnoascus sp. 23342-1-I1]